MRVQRGREKCLSLSRGCKAQNGARRIRLQARARTQPGITRNWWPWSGSNRRPLPCHFPRRNGAFRQRVRTSDSEGQCSCWFHACSQPFTGIRMTLSDTARFRQGWQVTTQTTTQLLSSRSTFGRELSVRQSRSRRGHPSRLMAHSAQAQPWCFYAFP